jgi:lysophospholipase L1-like esterase
MTISTQTNKTIALGNGATTVFNYAFFLDDAAHMYVVYTDTAGAETVVTSGQYILTGVGSPTGGTLQLLFGTPIALGTKLTMMRVLPYTQPLDIVNQDGFYAEVVEQGFDNLEMQIQQLNESIGRSLRLDVSETNWDFLGHRGINLGTPTANTDAATKAYVDSVTAGVVMGVFPDHSIANVKLVQFPGLTILGNDGSGTADPQYLTVAEVNTLLGIVSPGGRMTVGAWSALTATGVTNRIACRGDSLTFGLGFGGVQVATPYPAALQLSLREFGASWGGATVLNRGVSGSNSLDVYNKYLVDFADVANWATNGGGASIQIISVGTNSPLANPETTTQYRDRMRVLLQTIINNGQLPILMTPPATQTTVPTPQSVAPYSRIMKQLAMEFDLFCFDAQLQIGWQNLRYFDGLHYTAQGYNELGWHLAALFAPNASGGFGPVEIGVGTRFEWDSIVQFGGVAVGNAAAKKGVTVNLAAAESLILAAEFTEDVVPIFSTVNASLTNQSFSFVYAGGNSGVPTISCLHDGARDHREFRGPLLPKGLRKITIPVAAVGLQIESVRFMPPNNLRFGMAAGFVRPVQITGIIPPGLVTYINGARGAPAVGKVTDIDFSVQLFPAATGAAAGSGSELVTYCTLVNAAARHGFVFAANAEQVSRGGINDGVEVARGGASSLNLVFRKITAGVVAETTFAGVFGAVDVTGKFSVRLTGGPGTYTLTAYDNAGAALGNVGIIDAWAQAGLYVGRVQYNEVPLFNIITAYVADLI